MKNMNLEILLLDCSEYGQPDGVLRCWEQCLRMKGISYFRVEKIDNVLNDLNKYSIIVLSSVPHLKNKNIQRIKEYVQEGGGLVATGPIGMKYGIDSSLEEVFGVKFESVIKDQLVPFVEVSLDPFQREDVLLFLHDISPKPRIVQTNSRIIAGSLKWNSQSQKYVLNDEKTIVQNNYGKGKAVYVSLAAGDESKIPPLTAEQWDPTIFKEEYRIGYPHIASTIPQLSAFLISMISLVNSNIIPLVWVGHWPNGWRTTVSLTGDIHETEKYINYQIGAGELLANYLKEEGLEGLFTFSVTGKALEQNISLFKDLVKRGYQVIPHSAYKSTWMDKLSDREQKKEIEKCLQVYRNIFLNHPKGWRSHGWSGNEYTEKILDEKGFVWVSNLILQRYGEFGEKDFHIPIGEGIASICLPTKSEGLSILRLPMTSHSAGWICHILNSSYGLLGSSFFGQIDLFNEMNKLLKREFFKDWRLEELHLVDWHPWEEFIQHPAYKKAIEQLVQLYKETQNTGILQSSEIAQWWLLRENILIRNIKKEKDKIVIKCDLPEKTSKWNPTINFSKTISGVTLENGKAWRFFGEDWITLPTNLRHETQITIELGQNPDISYPDSLYPYVIDSTSYIQEAYIKDDILRIVLEEKRLKEGKISLYLPRPYFILIDNKKLEKKRLGYQTITYKKGQHVLLIK
jgi:hypothetical protein